MNLKKIIMCIVLVIVILITNKVLAVEVNYEITKENSDYSVSLKVGEEYIIETDKEVTGYAFMSNGTFSESIVEIDKESKKIIGLKEGIATGNIYMGSEKKTMYVTVISNDEEQITNSNEETNTNNTDKLNNLDTLIEENKSNNIDNVTNDTKLPKTGEENFYLYVLLGIVIVCLVVSKIKLNHMKF